MLSLAARVSRIRKADGAIPSVSQGTENNRIILATCSVAWRVANWARGPNSETNFSLLWLAASLPGEHKTMERCQKLPVTVGAASAPPSVYDFMLHGLRDSTCARGWAEHKRLLAEFCLYLCVLFCFSFFCGRMVNAFNCLGTWIVGFIIIWLIRICVLEMFSFTQKLMASRYIISK